MYVYEKWEEFFVFKTLKALLLLVQVFVLEEFQKRKLLMPVFEG
jgi:hypothetical protein